MAVYNQKFLPGPPWLTFPSLVLCWVCYLSIFLEFRDAGLLSQDLVCLTKAVAA